MLQRLKKKEAQTALDAEKAKLSTDTITATNVVYNLTAEEKSQIWI